jgi:transcriptional regulator with XRE-family HTH domain
VPFPSQKKYGGKKEPAIRRIFRTNLRNRRLAIGMTAKQLADRLGVKPQWIHQLENPRGKAIPGLYLTEQLAVELGTTPADLLTPGRFTGDIDPDDDLRGRRK